VVVFLGVFLGVWPEGCSSECPVAVVFLGVFLGVWPEGFILESAEKSRSREDAVRAYGRKRWAYGFFEWPSVGCSSECLVVALRSGLGGWVLRDFECLRWGALRSALWSLLFGVWPGGLGSGSKELGSARRKST